MFLGLFLVLGAAVALGAFQYKSQIERAERLMKELRKELEEEQKEENNSNN